MSRGPKLTMVSNKGKTGRERFQYQDFKTRNAGWSTHINGFHESSGYLLREPEIYSFPPSNWSCTRTPFIAISVDDVPHKQRKFNSF